MQLWEALADPTRRRIIELLAERERSAGELFLQFSVTASAISQHLKILRKSGWVRGRVEGQRRIQILNTDALNDARSWLDDRRKQTEQPAEKFSPIGSRASTEIPEQGMLF